MASGVWDRVWGPAVTGGGRFCLGAPPLIPSHTDPQEPVAVAPWPPTRPGGEREEAMERSVGGPHRLCSRRV